MPRAQKTSRAHRAARLLLLAASVVAVAWLVRAGGLPPGAVAFAQSASDLDAYDFVEITAAVTAPRTPNPFTDAAIRGTFRLATRGKEWQVGGFCDSDDGTVHRVRFMPSEPGEYEYSIEYRQGVWKTTSSGSFRVRDGRRRGPIRVDVQHPWHFVWEGTGEHYFFNGTTAYWLIGWNDERIIESSIDRLSRLKVNRIRVTLAGRTNDYYGEPVMPGAHWTPLVRPWATAASVGYLHRLGRAGQRYGPAVAGPMFDALAETGRPEDIFHPGFDYSRFQVAYWQKYERALRFARDRDVVVSIVLDMNDSRVHPAAYSDDEQRFIRYAIARFAAFSNVTWDLGDDLDSYRDDRWTRTTGTLLKQWDPYRHLATSHPVDNVHQDRLAGWFDFTSFQQWSRKQHAFMLAQRNEQARLGRIIPQTNEEYGYEDHYPPWSEGPGSESADALRRMAWEIVMAGGYQTTGETARRGTHVWPDRGGGWMNGRGDDTMTMLDGYAHLVDFFTSFDWWDTEPSDELASAGNYCLAKPGEIYAVYLPRGGSVTLSVEAGRYEAVWWEPSTGKRVALRAFEVSETRRWNSPMAPGPGDWALLVKTRRPLR